MDNPTKEGQGKNDKELVEKLMGELAGILNFALEGLQRLQKNNYEFTMSQKSLALLEEYRLEINPYLDFVQAAIVPTKGKSTKKLDNKKLYSAFVEWCNETNHSQLNKTTTRRFMKEIRSALKGLNMDFTEKPSNSTNQFEGIMLTDQYEDLIKRADRTTAAKN